MVTGKPGRPRPWLDRPWVWSVVLLALPLAFSQAGWLLTLRGYGLIESEMELAQANGYYENLIRTTTPGARRSREVVERPPGWTAFADSGIVEVVADYQRWRLRPDLDLRWNGSAFRTNRLGYRGPEISIPKPGSTFRVVVLGSSNTIGHGVADEEVYPRLLERWLDQRTAPDLRVEVVNLAVSSDSPTQRLLRLQTEVGPLEPDWILGDITALDFSLEELHLRWVVEQDAEVPFDFVRAALRDSAVSADDSPAVFHKKLGPFARPMLDRTYAGWAAEASRLGVSMTVVILPRADSKTESPRLFRLFGDLARRHGLGCIDLSTLFDDLALEEFQVAPWDLHPNALGHRLISEGLGAALMADEDFSGQLSDPRGTGLDDPDHPDRQSMEVHAPMGNEAA